MRATNTANLSSNRRDRSLSLALPITTHYKVNNRNLVLFLESYKRGFNAIAYQYGKQFVETALFELPKHGYFKSSRHKEEREKSSVEAWEVTNILEAMLGQEDSIRFRTKEEENGKVGLDDSIVLIDMDIQEKTKEQKEVRQFKRLIKGIYDSSPEVIQTHKNESIFLLNERKSDTEAQKDGETLWSEWIEIWNENAANKLCYSLNSTDVSDLCGPSLKTVNDEPLNIPLYPFAQTSNILPLPEQSDPGIKITSIPEDAAESGPSITTPKNNPITTIPISSLTQCYSEDFQHLINVGKVIIGHLQTFQGKKSSNGINGCTVIAPLVAIYHFIENSFNNPASISNDDDYIVVSSSSPAEERFDSSNFQFEETLPNEVLEEIIDVQAPNILPIVRENLGLTKDALIIPSDVHDYLLKESFLRQSQFVGVCGGNILDEDHLGQFMKILKEDNAEACKEKEQEENETEEKLKEKNRKSIFFSKGLKKTNASSKKKVDKNNPPKRRGDKMAATLFFHEHVVCILKSKCTKNNYFYEIIDSLPSSTFLRCCLDDENNKTQIGAAINSIDHDHNALRNATDAMSLEDADKRMAQMIMIQQQREEQKQMRRLSLREGIALVDDLDENTAVALAAAVSAEEAERARAAIAVGEKNDSWTNGFIESMHDLNDGRLSADSRIHSSFRQDEESKTEINIDSITSTTQTQMNAVRIRCKDLECLEATLRWYACSRFTDENIQYIDEYEWDDRNIEFDPRVFQAFVWTES